MFFFIHLRCHIKLFLQQCVHFILITFFSLINTRNIFDVFQSEIVDVCSVKNNGIDHEETEQLKFSILLRLLDSSGCEDYIFRLADRLRFNVDLLLAEDGTRMVHRYQQHCLAVESENTSSSTTRINGFVNVFINENRWYVKMIKFPLFVV